MKTLRLSFDHPIKGTLWFRALSGQVGQPIKPRSFDTGTSLILTINTGELESGSWELVLKWEHEDRNFQHKQVFKVEEEKGLFKTSLYTDASLFIAVILFMVRSINILTSPEQPAEGFQLYLVIE